MNPRLPSSKKWTALPQELHDQIQQIFSENFAKHIQNGKIIVEGRIYPQEFLFRIGYLENSRLKQANFELSLDFDPNKQNALNQIHFAVDCAASLLQEYFENDQDLEPFPKTWSSLEVEKKRAYFQTTTINTDLEAQADELLGESEESLVKGQDELDIIDDEDPAEEAAEGPETSVDKKTIH